MIRKKSERITANNQFSWNNKSEGMVLTVVEEMTSCKKSDAETLPLLKPGHKEQINEILLVEDSPIMQDFYRRMLENFSFSVRTMYEDEPAVDFAADSRPRLVLIDDAGKPDEAIKIAKKFRHDSRTSSVPIVLMLPADLFKHFHKKAKYFVDICIPKTFTPAILMPSLQSLLSS